MVGIREQPASAWQPIASAPKDGTWFVAKQDDETYPCEWQVKDDGEGGRQEGWFDHFNQSFEAPTHWYPAGPVWLDISTAPQDGSLILVPGRYGVTTIACWWPAAHLEGVTLRGDWDDGERNEEEGLTPFNPQVWMPLPGPPSSHLADANKENKGAADV